MKVDIQSDNYMDLNFIYIKLKIISNYIEIFTYSKMSYTIDFYSHCIEYLLREINYRIKWFIQLYSQGIKSVCLCDSYYIEMNSSMVRKYPTYSIEVDGLNIVTCIYNLMDELTRIKCMENDEQERFNLYLNQWLQYTESLSKINVENYMNILSSVPQ